MTTNTEDECRKRFEDIFPEAVKYRSTSGVDYIGHFRDAFAGWQEGWWWHEQDWKDAARYRWFRSGNTTPCVLMQAVLAQGELDAAIDAAIEKEQG